MICFTVTSAPQNFAVLDNTNDKGISVSWDTVQGAVSYNISVNDGKSTQMYNYVSSPATIPTILGTVYNFNIQGLDKDGQLGDPTSLTGIEAGTLCCNNSRKKKRSSVISNTGELV